MDFGVTRRFIEVQLKKYGLLPQEMSFLLAGQRSGFDGLAAFSSTRLSTICAKAQRRGARRGNIIPRTRRPSRVAFYGWLERACAGEQLEYHRGLLTRDRSPASGSPRAIGVRWPRLPTRPSGRPGTAAFMVQRRHGRSTSATSPSRLGASPSRHEALPLLAAPAARLRRLTNPAPGTQGHSMAISLASLNRTTALKPPRILIHGVHGVGKTTFAAGADPVFVLTEDGLGTLEVPHFPLARTFDEVMQALAALYTEDHASGPWWSTASTGWSPDPRQGLQGPGLELDRGRRLRQGLRPRPRPLAPVHRGAERAATTKHGDRPDRAHRHQALRQPRDPSPTTATSSSCTPRPRRCCRSTRTSCCSPTTGSARSSRRRLQQEGDPGAGLRRAPAAHRRAPGLPRQEPLRAARHAADVLGARAGDASRNPA